jgi:iron complex outermembrane receptor protein
MLSIGRSESRRQEFPMLPRHARCGVSIVAVQAALLASSSGVFAQSTSRELPAVTVDAPATVKPKPRKPAVQTAGASRNSAKPIQRSVSVAATNEQ